MSAATASGPGANAATSALLNSLLAWWGCHEASGNSRLDATGNGNALAETNGTVGSAAGLIGQAALLVADSHCLRVASALFSTQPLAAITFACWINPVDLSSTYTWMSCSQNTASRFAIKTSNAGNTLWTLAVPTLTSPVKVGIWTHIATTFDGGTTALYVNGILQTSGQGSTNSTSNSFVLGADGSSGTSSARGSMQMAGVWGRALSGNEVAALYNGGAGLDYPFAIAG